MSMSVCELNANKRETNRYTYVLYIHTSIHLVSWRNAFNIKRTRFSPLYIRCVRMNIIRNNIIPCIYARRIRRSHGDPVDGCQSEWTRGQKKKKKNHNNNNWYTCYLDSSFVFDEHFNRQSRPPPGVKNPEHNTNGRRRTRDQ